MMKTRLLATAIFAAPFAFAGAAPAQQISLQDSFRIGSGMGVLCSAQTATQSRALKDMFDRAYAVTCRDAAVPVGQLYALRVRGDDPAARLAAMRAATQCQPAQSGGIEGLGSAQVENCTMTDVAVGYRVYSVRQGNTLYVAEGLAGYDSALQLGLRTLVSDAPVDGEVSIATTEAGDPAAFARVQAGTLDPERALAEAYRRNNSGNYAESAEFFGALLAGGAAGRTEALVNQALQQSNLGNYVEANRMFREAEAQTGGDPVMSRMLRNYQAIHLLNQGRPTQALARLDAGLPQQEARSGAALSELVIDAETASRLNADSSVSRQLSAAGSGLLPEDKAQILDGQAQYLRGTALRLLNRPVDAAQALESAEAQLAAVRGGRVASTVWLRAQMMMELAAIAEERGDTAGAQQRLESAAALMGNYYPNSTTLLNTQARLASFYQRTGQTGPALALFKQIVDANAESGNSAPALRRTLAPYFALLADQSNDPAAVADMFKASQVLVRPGVAQTQAVLARELSGGSDEAARMFRQSVNLTRDIERLRGESLRLAALAQPTAAEVARLNEVRTQLGNMKRDQTATQAKLAEFPRYRVVSGGAMALSDLQSVLREGEAYYKMMVVGDAAYAILATPNSARAFRIAARPADLEKEVDGIRNTISTVENGQMVTYPFDVALSHRMYGQLFGPVAGEMASVRHLVFEPDGAMLRLPANLLVMEQAGVDAYLAKARRPGDDGFDFTDVAWLGRDRDVSTAVSARAFRDVRQVRRSAASNDYIGFGQNAVPSGERVSQAATRSLLGESDSCDWSLAEWGRPISSEELVTASNIIGQSRREGDAQVVTGDAFTDTAIKERGDLSQYRIMHFATHGLVTAPRAECPARPALMTSFGDQDSDGLLTFAEIFDLKLDADLVILSACDTAGKATVAATREAGVTTGGDQALDGLVRAFVGAGGRSVVASHWPVPDDYDATKRLISGLFTAPAGTPTATALRMAQDELMKTPETSHPYYWSGFAIIGDGAAPVIAAGDTAVADRSHSESQSGN
ncbi:CHAT domain-containing protein [Allosphingosinicella indica]|uniref:CHAT domain-containing protein n=1 Tax=Allosphingosinicella indica TaxID=941907 RepID=A0A1X7G217_9SPHN|nr:CHAT domain-containing protein [Allosphingosinicella indica]SMF62076.1 CHAT domain-containing protein [Allosphingosinicella indica]